MERSWLEMDLPGFRFHPTEEELLEFYLKGAVTGKKFQPEIIRTINLYDHDPWELPGMARMGEREWYFFVPRNRICRRSNNSGRPNRTTERGFWKATGSDRRIRSVSRPNQVIGMKKTLVFYKGRAPHGTRTDWIMNEYRFPNETVDRNVASSASVPKDDLVLCKIYRKATPMKVLEQLAAIDAVDVNFAEKTSSTSSSSSSFDQPQNALQKPPMSLEDPTSVYVTMIPEMEHFEITGKAFSSVLPVDEQFSVQLRETRPLAMEENLRGMKVEPETENEMEVTSVLTAMSSDRALKRTLPELEQLQVPPNVGFEYWAQDPFLTPLRSPWLENWSSYYANVLRS